MCLIFISSSFHSSAPSFCVSFYISSSEVSRKYNSSREVRNLMPLGRHFSSGQSESLSSKRLSSAPSSITNWLSCGAPYTQSFRSLGNEHAGKCNSFPSYALVITNSCQLCNTMSLEDESSSSLDLLRNKLVSLLRCDQDERI